MMKPRPAIKPRMVALMLSSLGAWSLPAGVFGDVSLKWAWTELGVGPGGRGFEVLDIDGDGVGELLAAPADNNYWYEIRYEGGDLRQVWSRLPLQELVAFEFVAGPPAMVVALTPTTIVLTDAQTKMEIATFATLTADNRAIAVADFDSNGILDAIVCDEDDLYRYELLSGSLTAIKYGFGCSDLAVGQIDTDPAPEVALTGNISGGYVLDGISLNVDWGDLGGFGNHVELGDVDGDGFDEIVALSDYYDPGVRALDPQSNALLWEVYEAYPVALEVADVDPSPGEEVLWTNTYWSGPTVHVGATGEPLWEISAPNSRSGAIAVGDATGDGIPEIFWGSLACCGDDPGSVSVALGGMHEEADRLMEVAGPLGGVTVGDFDGTGEIQVAFTGEQEAGSYRYSGIAVHALADGRKLRVSGENGLPHVSGHEAIVSGQLDEDPQVEICVATLGQNWSSGYTGCHDGANLEQQWVTSLSSSLRAIVLAELDQDSELEFLSAATGARIIAQEAESGWLKWQTPSAQGIYRFDEVAVLDSNADGQVEVVGAFVSDSPSSRRIATYEPQSGAPLAGPWPIPLTTMMVRSAQNGLTDQLLVALENGAVHEADPITGVLGAVVASFPAKVRKFVVAEVTRDGIDDVVAACYDGRIRIWDGSAESIAWTSDDVGISGWDGETLIAGDLDNDTAPEIVVSTWYGVLVFESGIEAIFVDGFESGDLSSWSFVVP